MKRKRFIYMLTAAIAFGSISAIQADNASNSKIYMEANTDFMDNHEVSMIAKVGQTVTITLVNEDNKFIESVEAAEVSEDEIESIAKKPGQGNNNADKYKISVVGEKGKIAEFTKAKGSNEYTWTPKSGQAGIFNVYVTTANINNGQFPKSNQILSQRKIYVDDKATSQGTNYYQISDFSISTWFEKDGKTYSLDELNRMTTTSSVLSIDSSDETTTSSALKASWTDLFRPTAIISLELGQSTQLTSPRFKIEVGEELIWKKTVKDYNDIYTGKYVEGLGFAKFDRGTYTLWGSVKAKDSIEAEDEQKIYYTRKKNDTPVINALNEVDNTLTVELDGGNPSGKYVFAFIKHDDLGAALLKDYSTEAFCPLPSKEHDYQIEVRVKHADNSDPGNAGERCLDSQLLPNAYEAHDYYSVKGTKAKLELSDVSITQTSIAKYYESDSKEAAKSEVSNTVYVNDKNYIHYTVTNAESNEKIYYRAWVIDNGVHIPLESFDDSQGNKYFVYYPKSGGNGNSLDASETHKLVVSAESSNGRTGSKTIELTVDDVE